MAETQNIEFPANYGKKWLPEEEKLLLNEISNNVDFETIAKTHERTLSGIYGKLRMVAYKMHINNKTLEEITIKTKLNNSEIVEAIAKHELKKKQKQTIKNTILTNANTNTHIKIPIDTNEPPDANNEFVVHANKKIPIDMNDSIDEVETNNNNKSWSTDEENLLLEELKNNTNIVTIAKLHKRTQKSIFCRCRKIAGSLYLNNVSIEDIEFKTKLSKSEITNVIKKISLDDHINFEIYNQLFEIKGIIFFINYHCHSINFR